MGVATPPYDVKKEIFSSPFESGWFFDVFVIELLLLKLKNGWVKVVLLSLKFFTIMH